MQEENANTLQPTIPNQNIFEAPHPQVTPAPNVQSETQPPTPPVKPKKFPVKILAALILIVIILLGALVVKSLVGQSNSNNQGTLVWWSLEEDEEAVTPLINEFEQQNPGIKIEFKKQQPQDYQERLTNALSKTGGPDIFEVHNSWVPVFRGALSSLPSSVMSVDEYMQTFYPVISTGMGASKGITNAALSGGASKGTSPIGIPLEYDGIALFVNQDLLQTYGKNPPKTWDDFRSIASTLTLRNDKGIVQQSGAAMGTTSNIDYWQDIVALLMLQNGADLSNITSKPAQSALTFYTDFSKKDFVWDDTLPTASTYFINGKLAMYFGRYSDVNKVSTQNPSLHYAVVPVPQLPSTSTTIPSISYASYWFNGVAKNSTNTAAAWKFLKFMSSAETLRKLYENEKKIRGYGNLYPRVDMQTELLADTKAAPFVYQAGYAQSWYLYGNTNDGVNGINTQLSKPYGDAVAAAGGGVSDSLVKGVQGPLTQILASYGIVPAPLATP